MKEFCYGNFLDEKQSKKIVRRLIYTFFKGNIRKKENNGKWIMKSILSSILSLIVPSSSNLPYVSHYSYDFQHGWLNIVVSEYNSKKLAEI